ncbi:bifunctional 2-polyprenyl-6-hydroxyphenol methylase/3-demethylubiquinol 3-O-methyltransferase UbiG [Gammaproteobacteria bacterium]|jgi:2-polyprenyl-6-hydroxyphenyl methylase / 3-demethylubiquinone-9 3-methyltransferase|nr:bifunctional 2-polyprenyl-6-hydroxyphenol methylase/3-demethylubiquinol 3-O-methyltransferase UbiG [Pseudomonadota bacterium]MDB0063812.1 bifunctional 2-polyprenyl-6-hydroxyphenol methylase/3-demethylubiquinol 3-O-methyltransferase UbiG [Gammaproteobacteria bacterium]
MENFDKEELAKFDELAARWWDKDSEFKPLHDINPLRLNYIDEKAGLDTKKVVDIGCGGGILSESMALRGAQVKGIDLATAGLSVAKLHAQQSDANVEYEEISAEALAEREPASYDIVTCLEMLEHVPQPDKIIQACAKLVKPGGDLFFSTINRNPKSYLFAIVGAEYVLNLLPKGTHEYAKFIKPAELDGWIRTAGLDNQDLIGMSYNPLSGNYWLGKDVTVNYMMHAHRPA